MNYQRLSQTRTAKTNPQPQEKTRANYTPHPLEELQGWIGNRAMVRFLQQQRQEAEASGKLPSDSPRLRSIESYGQQSMLRKPLFRGLSHELMGNSQPQETPVQRQVSDGNANPAVEDKTDTPTQPPSRGIGKPLFRGLSHELMQELQQQGTPVQTKLTLGKAGDKYEQEADAIADQVVNQINAPTPSTANQEDKENQPNPFNTETFPSENTPIAAKPNPLSFPTSLNPGETVSQPVEQGIQQARSGGVPLAEGIREPMEQAFGADFSGVRVHTDVQSDELNQSLSSRAFTTGQDIFFRQGEYNPGSRGGEELLAHELTHVVQQHNMNKFLVQCGTAQGTEKNADTLKQKINELQEEYGKLSQETDQSSVAIILRNHNIAQNLINRIKTLVELLKIQPNGPLESDINGAISILYKNIMAYYLPASVSQPTESNFEPYGTIAARTSVLSNINEINTNLKILEENLSRFGIKNPEKTYIRS